jgi:Transposase
MAETRRKFDRDFKEGAVRLVRETGKPIAQVARDLGVGQHDRAHPCPPGVLCLAEKFRGCFARLTRCRGGRLGRSATGAGHLAPAALYAAVLDRVAGEIRSELTALVENYGSAADLLAHALGPSRGPRLHGPGSHGVLFADAATLTAEPELSEPTRRAVRTVAEHLAALLIAAFFPPAGRQRRP